MANKHTIILNSYGREQLKVFFKKGYGIGFPDAWYDDLTVIDTTETDYKHALYRTLLGRLRYDPATKWLADKLPMRESYDIVIEILKNYRLITIKGDEIVETNPSVVITKPKPTTFVNEWKEASVYQAPLEIVDGDFNHALDLVMGVLSEIVENNSMIFTENYILRFDRFTKTLVGVSPRIEVIEVELPDLGTPVEDDGVG